MNFLTYIDRLYLFLYEKQYKAM